MAKRRVTGLQFWLALPRATEPVTIQLGVGDRVTMPRWCWVRAAAKVVLESTTPGLRYIILRQGFIPFQTRFMPTVDMLSAFTFDTNETRAIFEYIGRYAAIYEWHLLPGFALQYERERQQQSSEIARQDEETPVMDPSEIAVEKVRDGSLRRVR